MGEGDRSKAELMMLIKYALNWALDQDSNHIHMLTVLLIESLSAGQTMT